jgi:hypothetical protein
LAINRQSNTDPDEANTVAMFARFSVTTAVRDADVARLGDRFPLVDFFEDMALPIDGASVEPARLAAPDQARSAGLSEAALAETLTAPVAVRPIAIDG